MREAGKSYLWCTEAWLRTKPGTTPGTRRQHVVFIVSAESRPAASGESWIENLKGER